MLVAVTGHKVSERWRPAYSTSMPGAKRPQMPFLAARKAPRSHHILRLAVRVHTSLHVAGTARCSVRRARLTRHGAPRAAWQGSHTRQAATCSCWRPARSCLRCAAQTVGRRAGCCLPRCVFRCITVECKWRSMQSISRCAEWGARRNENAACACISLPTCRCSGSGASDAAAALRRCARSVELFSLQGGAPSEAGS